MKTNESTGTKNIPTMVAQNMGASIKTLILQEMKVAPDVWQRMSEKQQQETVYRVERGVKHAITAAVNTLASGEMPRLRGYVESISIKDKIKATIIVSSGNSHDSLSELYQSGGETECQLVLADSEQFVGGMDLVELEESDQPDMIDIEDSLLWCVVIPIRSGQSVIPAAGHKIAQAFAAKARQMMMEHDSDIAASVYAMPWQENKAAHARLLKKGCWQQLEEWYQKLEAGEVDVAPVALIDFVPDHGEA